jgi:murein DD-endopeptidase MepM/ murein hydrolase activator NlpD
MKFGFLVMWLTTVGMGAAPATATSTDIQFCPSAELRTYPLESRRQIESVVLQDLAIVRQEAGEVEITGIDIDLLHSGETMDTRRLVGSQLKHSLSQGPVPRPAQTSTTVPCMHWDEEPLGAGSGNPILKKNRALFLAPQLLTFQGPRDTVRVTVRGRTGQQDIVTNATIPLRSGMSRTVFRFPLRGAWWVGVGATSHTGHRWSIGEEFALDIGKLGGEGLDHSGSGNKFADFYAYGADVLAAANGKIIAAVDGAPEHEDALRRPGESTEDYSKRFNVLQHALIGRGAAGLLGNYVVIDHGNSEFALYAHLQPGSVRVRVGENVREGTAVGQLGSSGNSTSPHLHFQVCDGPDPLDCAGIPISFKGLALPWADYPRPVQSGDWVVAN